MGREPREEGSILLGLMQLIHSGPVNDAFARLLKKELRADDYIALAHIFEEMSVLALHRHIGEDLLFDAFALDMYWDELREDIAGLRRSTGNAKFGENFEIAAERARDHRRRVPTKLRWHRDEPPDEGWGHGPGGRTPPAPEPSSPAPAARGPARG